MVDFTEGYMIDYFHFQLSREHIKDENDTAS